MLTVTLQLNVYTAYVINYVLWLRVHPLFLILVASLRLYVNSYRQLVNRWLTRTKTHWFLCGLGATFETFSTAIRASKPPPSFRDLLSQAESHELFLKSLHGSVTTPTVAFAAEHSRSESSTRGRGRSSRGGGRGRGRRNPHCQLCRTNGHYASHCPDLATYATNATASNANLASYATNAAASNANLAQAFHAQCHVTDTTPDWYVADSGASTHMKASPNNLSLLVMVTLLMFQTRSHSTF